MLVLETINTRHRYKKYSGSNREMLMAKKRFEKQYIETSASPDALPILTQSILENRTSFHGTGQRMSLAPDRPTK